VGSRAAVFRNAALRSTATSGRDYEQQGLRLPYGGERLLREHRRVLLQRRRRGLPGKCPVLLPSLLRLRRSQGGHVPEGGRRQTRSDRGRSGQTVARG
jgi:hypothetical protein